MRVVYGITVIPTQVQFGVQAMELARLAGLVIGAIMTLAGYTQDITWMLIIGIILLVVAGVSILIFDFEILGQ